VSELSLEGRIAVVTRAGRGCGFGIAQCLGQAGAHVVIAEHDPVTGACAVETLRGEGLSASYHALDMGEPAQSLALVDALTKEQEAIDIWVNYSGDVPGTWPAELYPDDGWEDVMKSMLSGTFYCSRAAGQKMLARGRGVIVNVTSSEGIRPVEGRTAYCSAAAGVMMLTQALGVEWARRGVRVVGVTTGVETAAETQLPRIPLRRPARIEEVAEAVLYLACDKAAHIVAETLRVDGGWSAYQLF